MFSTFASSPGKFGGLARRPIAVSALALVFVLATAWAFTSRTDASDATKFIVPDLVGADVSSEVVKSAVQERPGTFKIVYAPSTVAPPGMVVQESPAQGTEVSVGTVVTVTVSSGFPDGYEPPALPKAD